MSEEKNIYQKLNAIMRDVSYIQKESKKVNNQYTFVSHDAVTAKIRPALLEHGVIAIPDFFDISQDGNKTYCKMKMTFVNMDKPDDRLVIDCAGFGQGIDPQDKGAGKAMSYAYKYALLKVFALETGDDPEQDSIDHVSKAEEKQKKAQAWVNEYLVKLEAIEDSDRELMPLQTENQAMLKRIADGYPDLHKVIVKVTDKVRGAGEGFNEGYMAANNK